MSSQEMAIRPVGWLHGRLGTVVLWALLILTESAGQLFTKVAGDQIGQMDFNWQWLAAVAVNPGILAAIACYIGAFFVWMLILRRSSLSLAFPPEFAGVCGGAARLVVGAGRAHQLPALGGRGGDYWRDCTAGRGRRKLSPDWNDGQIWERACPRCRRRGVSATPR